MKADSFGGVIGLIVTWFGALVGPISIPMLFGLLPTFKRCGPAAAITSWAGGILAFALIKYGIAPDNIAATVGIPVLVSVILYIGIGLATKQVKPEAATLIESLSAENENAATVQEAEALSLP
jgi:SSS family solute:Na+ symporter